MTKEVQRMCAYGSFLANLLISFLLFVVSFFILFVCQEQMSALVIVEVVLISSVGLGFHMFAEKNRKDITKTKE